MEIPNDLLWCRLPLPMTRTVSAPASVPVNTFFQHNFELGDELKVKDESAIAGLRYSQLLKRVRLELFAGNAIVWGGTRQRRGYVCTEE
jgi:hypothetical protein